MLAFVSLAPAGDGPGVRIAEIAPGVYAATRTEPPGLTANGNSVFIVNEQDVVVVDTTLTPSTARELLAAIRRVTDKPVSHVINTHWHDDHILGNAVFKEAFPDAQFVAHERVAEYLPRKGLEARQAAMSPGGYPAFIEFLRGMVQTGNDPRGQPLDDDQKHTYASDLRTAERYMAEVPRTEVVLPTITLKDRLTLTRGARTIEILHLGRGHTSGDVVVHLPAEGIVVAGDLVIWPVPYVGSPQSHPGEWAGTLRKLLDLQPRQIVPGHGPVLTDDAYVKRMIALFEAVSAQVAAGMKRGDDLEALRKTVDLATFEKEFAGTSKVRRAIFRNYVVGPAVEAEFLSRKSKGE